MHWRTNVAGFARLDETHRLLERSMAVGAGGGDTRHRSAGDVRPRNPHGRAQIAIASRGRTSTRLAFERTMCATISERVRRTAVTSDDERNGCAQRQRRR
jgi:hypothetical protein